MPLFTFWRIADIPFETCAGTLQSWQRTGRGGELGTGRSLARGPVEHDSAAGTCRIEVRLARGRLRPPLRMRLDIERWTWSPARTALELVPCQRVRPTARYFRAGHLLLDSLIHALKNARDQGYEMLTDEAEREGTRRLALRRST